MSETATSRQPQFLPETLEHGVNQRDGYYLAKKSKTKRPTPLTRPLRVLSNHNIRPT